MNFHIAGRDGSHWDTGLDAATNKVFSTTKNVGNLSFDTIAGAEQLPHVDNYTAVAQSPQVSSPNPNPDETIPQTNAPSETTFSQEYYSAFAEHLDGWIIDEYGLTEEQVQQVIFSHMTGITPEDPLVEAALMALDGRLEDIAEAWEFPTEQDRENWKRQLDEIKELYTTQLQNEYGEHFEAALLAYAEENNLPEGEIAQLRFLHFNPENIAPGSDAADRLSEIEKNVIAELEGAWGMEFPENYTPPVDNTHFNAIISVAYDDAFEAAFQEGIDSGELDIGALATELGLTEEEVVSYLNYLHFNPEATFSGSEALATVVANLENIAMESVRSEFGIVEDFPVETGSFYYNAVFDGEFNRLFYNNLQNADPPLTQDEINEIMTMLADPLNSDITSHPIFLKTVGEVKELYDLPGTWMPTIEGLESLTDISLPVSMGWNYINGAEEFVEIATLLISSFPDSPEKALLINFLAVVSQALARLREQIAVMQIMDSQIGQELSTVRMETAIHRIELRQEAARAAEESQQKEGMQVFMEAMGPLGKVMEVVMNIIIIAVAFAVLGPVGGVIAAMLVTSMFVLREAAPEALVAMYGGIMDACCEMFGNEFGSFAGMALCLGVSLCGGYSGISAFFENSGAIERFLVEGCGVNETTAMWVNMAFQMAVEVVIMIAMSVASGGSYAAVMIGQITARIAQVMVRVTTVTMRMVSGAARMCGTAGRLGIAVGARLQSGVTYLGSVTNRLARASDDLLQATNRIRQAQVDLKEAQNLGNIFAIARTEREVTLATNALHDALHTFRNAYVWIMRVESVTSIVTSSIQIDSSVRQADLALFEAEIDAAIEDLKALLKILNQLLAIIMGGGDALGEWLVGLAEQMDQAWANRSLTLSGIYEQQG